MRGGVQIKIHPAANLFPMMGDDEYARLRDDIAANGLRESLVFWKDKLIDGRNRLRACEELGIDPGESELDEDQDPVSYVLSANLHRRQLKTSQRAMCAAKMAGLERGRPELNSSNELITHGEAAALFNVGVASIKRALDVLHDGCVELIRLCELGELSVNAACKLIEMCVGKKEQAKIAKKGAKAVREYMAFGSTKEKSPADSAIALLMKASTEDRQKVAQWLAGV